MMVGSLTEQLRLSHELSALQQSRMERVSIMGIHHCLRLSLASSFVPC